MLKSTTQSGLVSFTLVIALAATATGTVHGARDALATDLASTAPPSQTFAMDGVMVQPAISPSIGNAFQAPTAGPGAQVAVAFSIHPYREATIVSVPYGFTESGELNVVASPGGAPAYSQALQTARASSGCTTPSTSLVSTVPNALIFGQSIAGQVCVGSFHVGEATPSPSAVYEWVTEAQNALWIVRYGVELQGTSPPATPSVAIAQVSSGAAVSASLTRQQQSGVLSLPAIATSSQPGARTRLATWITVADPAPWWNGSDCDSAWYTSQTGLPAGPLGAVFHGLEACGANGHPGGPDACRYFNAQQPACSNEWECTELVSRWLFEEYGIPQYLGDGKDMVNAYRGNRLVAVQNSGVPGVLPSPGDVMSFGSYAVHGHTAVVSAFPNIDANGNGSVQVIEQNASSNGWDTVPINNWVLGAPIHDGFATSNWLHDQNSPAAAAHNVNWQVAFWRGGDGGLWEAVDSQSGWGAAAEWTFAGTLASAPTVAVDSSNNEYVFWEGTDGSLREAWWTGSWHGPSTIPGTVGDLIVDSAPSVAVNSSQQDVWWQGSDGRLWESYYSVGGGTWYGPSDLGFGPMNSAPSAADTSNGSVQWVWWNESGSVGEAWYAGGHWYTSNLGMGPIASGPGAAYDPSTGIQWIAFEGQGGSGLFVAKYTGSWQLSYIGEGSSPSPPSLTAPGGGQIDIFAQGFDGNLYQSLGIPPPSWTGPFNLGYAPV